MRTVLADEVDRLNGAKYLDWVNLVHGPGISAKVRDWFQSGYEQLDVFRSGLIA